MNRMRLRSLILVALACVATEPARARALDRAFRAVAARLARGCGGEGVREGEEILARRVGTLAVRHGDEALGTLLHPTEPGALRLVAGASEAAGCGDRLLIQKGDAAARVPVRTGRVVEPAGAVWGIPAARALEPVGLRPARRLARMAEAGDRARTGRAAALLEVDGRPGDRALDYVWRHKGALAVSTALVAFLRDPEPFLVGLRDWAGVLAREAARPVVQIPGLVVNEVLRQRNWTLPVALLAALAVIVGIRRGLVALRRRHPDQRRVREGPSRGIRA